MRASLRATYGLDLRVVLKARDMPAGDLADLVAWLPLGCPLWRSYGGPASLTDETRMLRSLEYTVQVLDYHAGRHGKGKRPTPPKDPDLAHEKRAKEDKQRRKGEALLRRQRSAIAD